MFCNFRPFLRIGRIVLRDQLIPEIACCFRPGEELLTGHLLLHETGVVFPIRPLVDGPDLIVLNFLPEAAAGADISANLRGILWGWIGAVAEVQSRLLDEPLAAVWTALGMEPFLKSLHQFNVNKIAEPVEV